MTLCRRYLSESCKNHCRYLHFPHRTLLEVKQIPCNFEFKKPANVKHTPTFERENLGKEMLQTHFIVHQIYCSFIDHFFSGELCFSALANTEKIIHRFKTCPKFQFGKECEKNTTFYFAHHYPPLYNRSALSSVTASLNKQQTKK
jgi:hypothetical protein